MSTAKVTGETDAPAVEKVDWYERRHELDPGMVFATEGDGLVNLDLQVPGDGSKGYIATWWNGWAWMDSTIEPVDLVRRMPDDYEGPSH